MNISPNEAVGVFTSGNGPMNVTNNANVITIGDNSYGFVLRSGATPERIQANGGTTGLGATTFVSNTPSVTLGNDAVYVYSADSLGTVTNNTAITTTGSNNYGLYSVGNVVNNTSGNMNLTSGVGNVGIYSIENGNAKNYATIDVGSSDRDNKYYSIGMAAGYYNENTRRIEQTGTVENHGTINVNNDYGIGMYAVGNGSKAVNYGTINLDGKGTTGMYLDQNATGINYGTIQTSATPSNNGIIGVAYLHEDETVKLGNTSGWYAGAVYNQFKFKDIGGSKENQIMLKSGIFKSVPFDHNNSLNWIISAEGFISRNEMNRKFLVLDEIFNANSHYYAYGAAVKNEISKAFRTSERTSITPYGSLKLEYGRLSKISEKSGQVRLEVKENDYYSVRPEVGIQFKYKQPMAVRTTFTTSLNLAYENELGKINDVNNRARVNYTTADWYNLRNEKEDRKGNFKADLNFGIENQRFGVTLNAGYDTKGENMRGIIGFRAIY